MAIGFSSAYLTQLGKLYHAQASPSFSLYKVKYEPDEQEALVEANYSELRKLIDAGAFKVRGSWYLLDNRTPEQIAQQDAQIEQANKKLMRKVVELFPTLYELKSPAFREEQEWRLVSFLVDARHDSCEFRAARGRIVPYRAFEMKATGTQPIVEVIIAPKHETPPEVVESLLRQAGHTNATVRRSSATYR